MADRNGYIGRAPGDSAVTVARQTFTLTGVTTDFTFASGYVPGYFDIYINGAKQIEVSDYTATDGSTFSVLNGGAQDGDVIEGVAYKAFNAAAVTNAADLTVSGNLTVNGTATFLGAGTSVAFATTSYNLAGAPDITVNNLVGVAATFSGDVQFGAAGVAGSVTSSGDAVFAGIVTASDGRLIAGVGIQSAGTLVGYGVTQINFIGAGNTFALNGTTVDVSISGGGGGSIGTSGITTQTIFSNPNIITEEQFLTNPNHNYGMFGPVSIANTINVGAGNTFVVV